MKIQHIRRDADNPRERLGQESSGVNLWSGTPVFFISGRESVWHRNPWRVRARRINCRPIEASAQACTT